MMHDRAMAVDRIPIPAALLAAAFAALLCAMALVGAPCAWADESIDTDPSPDDWQLVIEQSSAALEQAQAKIEEAEESISQNQSKLDELALAIPAQQERSDLAARELYKFQQQRFGIVEFLLCSEDFYALLQNWEYVSYITEANQREIARLGAMKEELDQARADLEQAKATAEAEAVNAENALRAAQEARLEAQRRAEEAARAAAAAAAAAQAAAAQEATVDENGEVIYGGTSGGSTGNYTPDGADWTMDKETFVSHWGGRIDAYLAGSPLGGYGRNFAEAAWNYGVDPRWSPAISSVESGKGAVCFRSHNAWGWGSISWGSWEEAIDAHVRGLARGYGYTITLDAARMYCPPTYQLWYDRVCTQMNMI